MLKKFDKEMIFGSDNFILKKKVMLNQVQVLIKKGLKMIKKLLES